MNESIHLSRNFENVMSYHKQLEFYVPGIADRMPHCNGLGLVFNDVACHQRLCWINVFCMFVI